MFNIDEILEELNNIKNKEALDIFFQKYLGKKWLITEAFKKIKDLSVEEKKTFGAELSSTKETVTHEYDKKLDTLDLIEINKKLESDIVDISVEKADEERGNFSLLTQTRRELEELCLSMWFRVETGNDMVTKYENFESVNIPLSHPATEMHDTFYINETDNKGENFVLRTHTSSTQNYIIKKYGVPLKAVIPGRCYRFDDMDASHDTMFYQLEWIYIDENISIAHFKNMITWLLSKIIGKQVEIRMRPGHFPFVEPGFEIDARYDIIDPKSGEKTKSKWLELLGAGMIHPNVLEMAGVNSEKYTGFAFGIGISRLAGIRYGIKDIRYFTNGDLRFSKSFSGL